MEFFPAISMIFMMVCMMSSMSEANTTTYDFVNVFFDIALDKGDRLLKYLVSSHDINTTRFSFTLSMSSCVNKKIPR